MGVPAGVVLANVVFLLCTQLMTEEQFTSWGWRVPFLLSATLVMVAMWIRLGVMESPAFEAVEKEDRITKVPLVEVLTKSWRTVLLAGGTFVATNGIAYVFMVLGAHLRHHRARPQPQHHARPADRLLPDVDARHGPVGVPTPTSSAAAGSTSAPPWPLLVTATVFFTLIDTGSIPVMLAGDAADGLRARLHGRPAVGALRRAVPRPRPLQRRHARLPGRRHPRRRHRTVRRHGAVRRVRLVDGHHGVLRVPQPGQPHLHAGAAAPPARRRARGGPGPQQQGAER